MSTTTAILIEIAEERERQIHEHGRTPEHDDSHGRHEWAYLILSRAVAIAHPWDTAVLDYRRQLVEIAAIAAAAVEAHDRQQAAQKPE